MKLGLWRLGRSFLIGFSLSLALTEVSSGAFEPLFSSPEQSKYTIYVRSHRGEAPRYQIGFESDGQVGFVSFLRSNFEDVLEDLQISWEKDPKETGSLRNKARTLEGREDASNELLYTHRKLDPRLDKKEWDAVICLYDDLFRSEVAIEGTRINQIR